MTLSEKQVVLERMRKYCAYQERCHQEVRMRLIQWKVYGDDLEEVIYDLVREGFLNEERFARSFARGKFRLKQWGKLRIENELKRRDVSDYCRRKALEEIDEEEYKSTARQMVQKMLDRHRDLPSFQRRQKTVQSMLRKGFEYQEIEEAIGQVSLEG